MSLKSVARQHNRIYMVKRMAKRRGKNFIAIRIRKQLKAVEDEGGKGVPILVNYEYYAQMQQNIGRELEKISKVEYLNAGYFCDWKGHKIFLMKNAGLDPIPFPKGAEIIKEIDNKRRGRC